MIYSLKLDSCL